MIKAILLWIVVFYLISVILSWMVIRHDIKNSIAFRMFVQSNVSKILPVMLFPILNTLFLVGWASTEIKSKIKSKIKINNIDINKVFMIKDEEV